MADGLGDIVERITKATGVEGVVKKFTKATGIDCGCERRKKLLNELFPFKRKQVECMTRTQYEMWKVFRENQKGETLTIPQQEVVVTLHAELFKHKKKRPCSCNPKEWRKYVDDINLIYGTYKSKGQRPKTKPE